MPQQDVFYYQTMTRAILTCFHKYQPFGDEFYAPILEYFIKTMENYKVEYDKIYFLDSTWNIDPEKLKNLNFEIIKINPSTRYYDAYRETVPQVKEDLILFMDNDMMIYKPGIINKAFTKVDPEKIDVPNQMYSFDVISIYDTIGTYETDKLGESKNKFCPYWLAARKDLLMKYLDVDWGPDMPYCETLGHLTEKMLEDGIKPYEVAEDKTDFPTKNLGYYHIRAGSTPAYLLAEKHYGNKDTYWSYLKNQPKSEYLRQCEWYRRMGGDPTEIIEDSKDL